MKNIVPFALLTLTLASPAFAQIDPPPVAPTAAVSLELNKVFLADALKALFTAAKVSFKLDEDLPANKVTMSLKDLSLRVAVEQIIDNQPVTVRLEQGVWVARRSEPEAADEQTRLFNLRYLDTGTAGNLLKDLTPAGVRRVTAVPRENAVVAVGTAAGLDELAGIMRLLDVKPKAVTVQIEVAQVEGKKRTLLFAPSVVTQNNQEAKISTQLADSNKPVYSVTVTPHINGDNTVSVQVKCVFTITLPSGEKGTTIRLQKEIDTFRRSRSGEVVTLGTTDLSRWGSPGKVVFTLTAQIPEDGAPIDIPNKAKH